jgi:archaemetzincin
MTEIQIVPVGSVDPNILDYLSVAVSESMNARCTVSGITVDPSDTFDTTRRQYNSTRILSGLLDAVPDGNGKLLGVADVDLFIPILTFVFGEAQLDNRAALTSVHRLRQSFYGLPEDERLFFERCEKESLHELGHAFGMVHCRDWGCIMHFSNSIEQVDLRGNAFCQRCEAILKKRRARRPHVPGL